MSVSEDLENEVEAINSIYGDGTLIPTEETEIYVLSLSQHGASIRLQFPKDYPDAPPAVLGAQSSAKKGEAAQIVDELRDAIGRLFRPGEVVMFDVMEELNSTADVANALDIGDEGASALGKIVEESQTAVAEEEPPWVLSEVAVEMKSVFVARTAPVRNPVQAKRYVEHLLENDRKVRGASHNMTAWRIRGENGVTYQDCDDDGETAAGGRLLHLMQLMEIWDAMVVVTRWYGGHHLGPKRFSIINTVARDAFLKGGYVKEEAKKKGKR